MEKLVIGLGIGIVLTWLLYTYFGFPRRLMRRLIRSDKWMLEAGHLTDGKVRIVTLFRGGVATECTVYAVGGDPCHPVTLLEVALPQGTDRLRWVRPVTSRAILELVDGHYSRLWSQAAAEA